MLLFSLRSGKEEAAGSAARYCVILNYMAWCAPRPLHGRDVFASYVGGAFCRACHGLERFSPGLGWEGRLTGFRFRRNITSLCGMHDERSTDAKPCPSGGRADAGPRGVRPP